MSIWKGNVGKHLNVTRDSYGEMAPKEEDTYQGGFSIEYAPDGGIILTDNDTGKKAKFTKEEADKMDFRPKQAKEKVEAEQSNLDDTRHEYARQGMQFGKVLPDTDDEIEYLNKDGEYNVRQSTDAEDEIALRNVNGPGPKTYRATKNEEASRYNIDEEDPEMAERYPNIRKMLRQN